MITIIDEWAWGKNPFEKSCTSAEAMVELLLVLEHDNWKVCGGYMEMTVINEFGIKSFCGTESDVRTLHKFAKLYKESGDFPEFLPYKRQIVRDFLLPYGVTEEAMISAFSSQKTTDWYLIVDLHKETGVPLSQIIAELAA